MWPIYWHTSSIDACEVIWESGIFMAFEGHICC